MTCPTFLDLCFLAASIIVIDGDSLRPPEGPDIRVWALDAPEIATERGLRAATAMQIILDDATHIGCKDTGARSYDRIVARCWSFGGEAHGTDIALLMIYGGAATEWCRYSRGHYGGATCNR